MSILGIILIPAGLLITFLGVYLTFPGGLTSSATTNFLTAALVALTAALAIANFSLARSTESSLKYARQANERAEKLFGAQTRPLVQAKPFEFNVPSRETMTFGTISLRIINYSNFDAVDVRTDVMYDDTTWIGEWMKASAIGLKRKEQKTKLNPDEEQKLEQYSKSLNGNIGMLPGDSKNTLVQVWTGTWERKKKNRVSVRTIWKNERGFEFDRIDSYSLVITTGLNNEENFTFIPETTATRTDD